MIPDFTEEGLLPEGIYRATLAEIEERFVQSAASWQRRKVFGLLRELLKEAADSGIVKRVLVAGSFVTAKQDPNDFDCVIVIDRATLGQEFRPFEYRLASRRMARKAFHGDVLPAVEDSENLRKILTFFQTTRTGQRVGLVEIEL